MSTYVSAAVNNAAKRKIAYFDLAVFFAHLSESTGNYGIDITSISFDQVTKIITVVTTGDIPQDRYHLTKIA